MRGGVLIVLAWWCLGCEPPALLKPAPDLRIIWPKADGSLVADGDGSTVWLDPITHGCSTTRSLRVLNQGIAQARFSVSTSSADFVATAPEVLGAGEEGEVSLAIAAKEWPSSVAETELTFELEEWPAVRIQLRALAVSGEWDVPRRLDFGGVKVGTTATLGEASLVGLAGDFAMSGGQLQFSPRTLGRQDVEAQYATLLHCPFISQVRVVGDGVASVLEGPADVDFGDVSVGTTAEREVVIRNRSVQLSLQTVSGLGADFAGDTSEVPVATRDASGALVAGTSTWRLRFSPQVAGVATAELRLTVGAERLTIPLRGAGVP